MPAMRRTTWSIDTISYSMVPLKLARYPLLGVAWFGPQLRASDEHSFIVRVLRARGTNQVTPYIRSYSARTSCGSYVRSNLLTMK